MAITDPASPFRRRRHSRVSCNGTAEGIETRPYSNGWPSSNARRVRAMFGLPGSAAATTVALRTVRNEMRRSA